MRILLTTSVKGGVGKSTVAANLAVYLAKRGKKTLLCDLDFYTRSLDLILGTENLVLYDICDVLMGRASYSQAKITDTKTSNFTFLGAPFRYEDRFTPEQFARGIRRIGEENALDYIILDAPGADSTPLLLGRAAADIALVIATHAPASVRGGEKTAEMMALYGLDTRLILNFFDYRAVKDRIRSGISEIIDKTHCRLLGVIPYDPEMSYAQDLGVLADESGSVSARAFDNIAQRLIAEETGERPIPLLSGVRGIKRKKVLTK